MKKSSKKFKEENRDLWYKKMGDRIPIKPKDEPVSRFDRLGRFDEFINSRKDMNSENI